MFFLTLKVAGAARTRRAGRRAGLFSSMESVLEPAVLGGVVDGGVERAEMDNVGLRGVMCRGPTRAATEKLSDGSEVR